MGSDYFTANNTYLLENFDRNNIKATIQVNDEIIDGSLLDIKKLLTEINIDNDQSLLNLLLKLYSEIQSDKSSKVIQTEGFTIMHELLPLINSENSEIQAYVYLTLEYLAEHLDQDELAENMMNQLICISWDFDDMDECFDTARLSAVYFALFGKGLQKMTKARDWMLFLPFLSNYIVKTVDIMHTILKEKSIFFYADFNERRFSKWDKIIALTINNYLDFIQFIHEKTVSQGITAFPYNSPDIGLENGDTKRRYLGYYLLNLVYDKIIANFDLRLSKTYYEYQLSAFHNNHVKNVAMSFVYFNDSKLKPMLDIVHRSLKLSKDFGFLVDNIFQLATSLEENKDYTKSKEDELYENDRQMINARLYPLSFDGIATLFSMSLYDKHIYSCFADQSIDLLPSDLDSFAFSKKYIGTLLNLITRSADYISRADKGVFAMLYLSSSIKTNFKLEDIEKSIPSCNESQPNIPVSAIIMYLSSTASTCPDDSLRFLSFKLIEKFLDFGDDEAKLFFLFELIDACPYPSMNTAAIGLLKKYIDKARDKKPHPIENPADEKAISIFVSPLIPQRFFPVIFSFESCWTENPETFWDSYNFIMEALSLYLFMLKIRPYDEYLKVRDSSVQKDYIAPLEELIQRFDPIKVNTMSFLITLINEELFFSENK